MWHEGIDVISNFMYLISVMILCMVTLYVTYLLTEDTHVKVFSKSVTYAYEST